MLRKFIDRPVMATVLAIILVTLGILGLVKLPIQQFPDIAPPAVQVTANYPGANAETVLRAVAPSLEEAINGVENMTYMSSTASNDGSLIINIYFELGTDPDQATVNVQNRVSQATSQLPTEVIQAGITTLKQQNSEVMSLGIYSENKDQYDQVYLNNYSQINIVPELKRIKGVGKVYLYGGNKDYTMRVWLNPQQMATYNITPAEVSNAIQDKNLEAAPGKLGENSVEAFEYVIKYKGKKNQPEQYENMVIRSNADGSMLRLKDIAKVELGAYTYSGKTQINGKPATNIGIIQSPGSNAREIQIAVAEYMEKVSTNLPKGITADILYNRKDALDQSIEQVIHTMIEAFLLVFLVVYIFLQDFRSTLIPAIAVPVALVSTFFFMQLFGFSVNLLTLFALVLAIGIVVDDAIVVVEAVHHKMHAEHLPPKFATRKAMHEITGAIISITLVMSAVFVPIGFMEGSTGIFYRQFAFTLAIAIVISAINALTLSPVLCAIFLKPANTASHKDEKVSFKDRFFIGFNSSFSRFTSSYLKVIRFLIRFKWIAVTGILVICASSYLLIKQTPTAFIPSEDQSFIGASINLPAGASLKRTEDILQQAEDLLKDEVYAKSIVIFSGTNILSNSSSPSAGVVFIVLKNQEDRGKVKDIDELMGIINTKLQSIIGANVFVFTFPTVPGFSNVDAIEMVLQDRKNGDLKKLGNNGNAFIEALQQRPEIMSAFSSFRADYPQYELIVNEDKAELLSVDNKDILSTLQSYIGNSQISDFNSFGKYYKVVMQADPASREDISTLDGIYLKNRLSEMVPIKSLVRLERTFGSEIASRYNLFNSMLINVIPANGYSSGDAIKVVEEVAKEHLPSQYSYEFSGITKEEISSGGQSVVIFLLCLFFVYLLLASQYESYILPLAVILSIPTGILGVFAFIGLAGISNNIYVQIALVMLIGLLAKNAILIVEFASQNRKNGQSIVRAALESAKLRLRPILMTSFAFIIGMLPMMSATGPSAKGNHSISIASAGGMLVGVVLGLCIIPILYVIFQSLHEKVSGKEHKTNPSEESIHSTVDSEK
ncbi:multidrug transporter AcrB [Empedobacter brevis]|uniref:efflux RND transporter permease subunit n=1 Tax=Empedobacter brevis TaxID=247 RepID=UPI00131FE912|nr:efflux RND transporter permease subunit [Empedobacter brevis]QHC86026.1 multidrug transporter AcrB [Empedobacter brevis]